MGRESLIPLDFQSQEDQTNMVGTIKFIPYAEEQILVARTLDFNESVLYYRLVLMNICFGSCCGHRFGVRFLKVKGTSASKIVIPFR